MAPDIGKRIARAHMQRIVDAILAFASPVCHSADGTAWFARAAAFEALETPVDDPAAALTEETSVLARVVRGAELASVASEGEPWCMISLTDMLAHLTPLSRAPVAVAYQAWLCEGCLPALMRHGWYNPSTDHQPPVGPELEALEQREWRRDGLHAVMPGIGELWDGSYEAANEA